MRLLTSLVTVAFCSAVPASAATLTYSNTQQFTATASNGNAGLPGVEYTLSNLFPQFVPTLGTLTAVSFSYAITVTNTGNCTSNGGPGSGGCDTVAASSIVGGAGLTVNDGRNVGFIYHGNLQDFSEVTTLSYSGTAAQALLPFIGSGTVGSIAATVALFNNNPGGSTFYTTLASAFTGAYDLTYTYTPATAPPSAVPEPGLLLLAAFGMLAGGARLRRR